MGGCCAAKANGPTHTSEPGLVERPARPPSSAAPRVSNQAHLRRLQAKLTVGAVDDPLEHEADAAADRVMRMADPQVSRSTPVVVSRKCAACEEEDKEPLRRKAAPGAAPAAAPPSVDAVLAGPGHRLEASTLAFMDSRFGADFGDVRIHTDAAAARSAAEVDARAYTVGNAIVFAHGHYDPASEGGRRLIAHELAHTLQQGGALRRAPCRSAAECAAPAPGDTAQFVTTITPVQSARAAAIAAAPPASALAAQAALIGAPVPNISALMAANGVALLPEVFGIFQSPAIEGNAGAQTSRCTQFPDDSPAGAALRTNPAAVGKNCIEVPPSLEARAGGVVGVAPPGTAAQREQRAIVLSTVAHEMEHAHFRDTQVATLTPTADCTPETIVRPNPDPRFGPFRVRFFLGEIAAISNEFPTYFDNFIANDNPTDHRLLFNQERNMAFNPGEGIVGVIRGLQCVCACASVNDLVTQTINLATASWTPRQRIAFLRAMTRIMPSFWPPALVTPDGPE